MERVTGRETTPPYTADLAEVLSDDLVAACAQVNVMLPEATRRALGPAFRAREPAWLQVTSKLMRGTGLLRLLDCLPPRALHAHGVHRPQDAAGGSRPGGQLAAAVRAATTRSCSSLEIASYKGNRNCVSQTARVTESEDPALPRRKPAAESSSAT